MSLKLPGLRDLMSKQLCRCFQQGDMHQASLRNTSRAHESHRRSEVAIHQGSDWNLFSPINVETIGEVMEISDIHGQHVQNFEAKERHSVLATFTLPQSNIAVAGRKISLYGKNV